MLVYFSISFVVSILIILSLLNTEENQTDILVTLPDGVIRGRRSRTTTNLLFWAFQKIPYAAPPVGLLRFRAPVPPQKWEGTLDATQNAVICYQVSSDSPLESEDCLYLNVYTPKTPDESENWALPVMFYIHGGGFIGGNCLDYVYGPEYLLDREVIVVTINYRLGPFGFLSTQDSTIPGNNGLKDQLLALQWTYKNIKLFGGDPEKITVFGQGAGSASVTYHLLNKKSQGLFRGAICESGSFLCPWAFQRNPRLYAFKTASYLNETLGASSNSRALLEFLQSVPAEDLDRASYQVSLTENYQNQQILQGSFYGPVIEPEHDGAFLTKKMYGLLKDGDFTRVPTLIGFNSEEYLYGYSAEWIENVSEAYDVNLDWLVPEVLKMAASLHSTDVGAEIRSIYTGGEALAVHPDAVVRYFSDDAFTRSIRKHAELQSKFAEVYFYQFSYDGNLGNFSLKLDGAEKITNGEENKYIWRMHDEYYDNSDLGIFSALDRTTQYRILKVWTDFAKFLNPTPEVSSLMQGITWPKVASNFSYVDILENLEVKSDPKNETYQGWIRIYDSLQFDDFDTY